MPFTELTREGVKSYVDAQKALMNVMVKPAGEHKHAGKTRHHGKGPRGRRRSCLIDERTEPRTVMEVDSPAPGAGSRRILQGRVARALQDISLQSQCGARKTISPRPAALDA